MKAIKRNIFRLLIVTTAFLFCTESNLQSQNQGVTNYLKGAVPLEDGGVVFRRSFNAPKISRDSLMILTRNWINGRDNQEEECSSKVLIFDEEKGSIVGGCREKLVFRSTMLVLDQADIHYYLHVTCTPGAVDMAIIRIRYEYEDNEKFTAEEMITDEVSLNKDQKRILKSSEKWRIKTIDFAKNLFDDYNYYLFRNRS